MAGPDKLAHIKSRAGLLLYRQLPEEYRYEDRVPEGAQDRELGHLEAYLHSFGHLLDLIRGTTEQAYADSFAEPLEPGFVYGAPGATGRRELQAWLLPYLAELVGAELLAPDPRARRRELAYAVLWAKSTGTTKSIDAVADVMTGLEVVVVEGWRRTLATPRVGLPPFSVAPGAELATDPLGPTPAPLGTPDFRKRNRAVEDPSGASPLHRLKIPKRDPSTGHRLEDDESHWKPHAPAGVPCFTSAFDDVSVRTPDVRDPETGQRGPHPRRIQLHIRPPQGLFEKDLLTMKLAVENPFTFASETATQVFDPKAIWKILGRSETAPDKLEIDGDLLIPPGLRITFRDLLFRGRIEVRGAGDPVPAGAPSVPTQETRLKLERCAVHTLAVGTADDEPIVQADDCLLQSVSSLAGKAFVQLVHCTVLGNTQTDRLWASDCIFVGALQDVECGAGESCIRYSSAPNLANLTACTPEKAPSNTVEAPRFVKLRIHDAEADTCELRTARFGEPGAGVLDLTTPEDVCLGAENGGEMGAGNHLFYCAGIDALLRKLDDFLPFGQEAVASYDHRLAMPAARVNGGNPQ